MLYTHLNTPYVQTVGRTNHQLDMHSRGIRSFPPAMTFPPFPNKDQPPHKQQILFPKNICQELTIHFLGVSTAKKRKQKNTYKEFLSICQKLGTNCNNDNLSQLYIHPTPPPKKQKLHMRWKTLSFHLGFPYGTTSVGCNSGSLEDRISLRLPWACEQKGHGWSDG